MTQDLSIKRIFAVLLFSIFSSTIGLGIITPLLPIYASQLGASGFLLGAIISSFSISRLAIIPFVGWFSDRRGRKIFIAAGLLIYTVSSVFYVWADSVINLVVIRLLHGMASGVIIPVAQAYAGDLIPKGKEGRLMGYFSASYVTGFGVGPLLGGLLNDHIGMNAAFYAMSFCNLLALLGVLLFIPEITPKKRSGTGRSPLREIIHSKAMWGLFSFRMGISSFRGILVTFLPVYAGIYIGLSASEIGILLTINAFTMSLFQIPCGRIADNYNRYDLVVIGTLISITNIFIVPWFNGFWCLMVILSLLSIGDATALLAASAMIVEEGRYFGMGMTMVMFNTSVYLGQAISPMLAGISVDFFSISSAFFTAAIFMFLGTGLFCLLIPRIYTAGSQTPS